MALAGKLTKENRQHLELIDALGDIAKVLQDQAGGSSIAPIVNVLASPPTLTITPSEVVVRHPDTPPPSYTFTVHRNQRGFIESITAEPT